MSARSASVPLLRDAAHDLRAQAARLGSAAQGTEQVRRRTEPRWWGSHADRWQNRARALLGGERRAESALRGLAGAVDRYADKVARAQHALEQIDREADAARAAAGQLLARWSAQPVADRGPRPSGVAALGPFHARQQQVEAQVERDAEAFASEVAAALHELDTLVAVPVSDATLVTAGPVWESVLAAAVLVPAPTRGGVVAQLVPAARPVVAAVVQPRPRTLLEPTSAGTPAELTPGTTALDALAEVVAPLVRAAAGSTAPTETVTPDAEGVRAAVAELSAAVHLVARLAWALLGGRPRPWPGRPRPTRDLPWHDPRPPLVPRPRELHPTSPAPVGGLR